MMIEPDEEGNLTPSTPMGPPALALFTLDGPLALMPGPQADPAPRQTVDTSALARAIEVAVSRAVTGAEVETTPLPVTEPPPLPVNVEPAPVPGPLATAPRALVATLYTRPHRTRSAVELALISIVLGIVLAAAIGLAAAVVVAVVNHAVGSSSTAP